MELSWSWDLPHEHYTVWKVTKYGVFFFFFVRIKKNSVFGQFSHSASMAGIVVLLGKINSKLRFGSKDQILLEVINKKKKKKKKKKSRSHWVTRNLILGQIHNGSVGPKGRKSIYDKYHITNAGTIILSWSKFALKLRFKNR